MIFRRGNPDILDLSFFCSVCGHSEDIVDSVTRETCAICGTARAATNTVGQEDAPFLHVVFEGSPCAYEVLPGLLIPAVYARTEDPEDSREGCCVAPDRICFILIGENTLKVESTRLRSVLTLPSGR